MLFDVYGPNAGFQWLGLAMVLIALILLNEFARRTKAGGIFMFFGVCGAMTVYCLAVEIGAASGAEWAVNNPTHTDMNSWFHYAKVYAATAGCIGFMMLKYSWGKIGRSHWFKAFPFVIVAINILIAVVSDFESAFRAFGTTWVSTEGVTLYGGWHNVFNGIAGLLNIACMTGWFGIYISKKRQDMLWPDMTWVFIIAYDLWNFCYTYNWHFSTEALAISALNWHLLRENEKRGGSARLRIPLLRDTAEWAYASTCVGVGLFGRLARFRTGLFGQPLSRTLA